MKGLWAAATAAVVAYTLLPLAWLVSLSLKSPATIADKRLWPVDPTLANYRSVLGSQLFTRALLNSVGVALLTTVLAVLVATAAAYALTGITFRGKALVLPVTLAVAVLPPVAVVGPLFVAWRRLDLFDTWPGLIVPYLSFALPLAMWTLTAYFRAVPWEMALVAQADGATRWQAFRLVVVPLARPGAQTAAILVFLFCWNDFLLASSLTSSPRSVTVPAALATFPGAPQFTQPVGSIAAAAVVVTAPVVVLVLVFQRRLVAALTAGVVTK
ncbi:MAG TPA: carbohydrate ABC transporter permease [Mycobacteriales bacterium]